MTGYVNESPIVGWESIAKFLATSKRTAQSKRAEMIEDNVLFTRLVGRKRTKIVFTYPSILKVWLMKKRSHGQRL